VGISKADSVFTGFEFRRNDELMRDLFFAQLADEVARRTPAQ
jgi:hypothetical protein